VQRKKLFEKKLHSIINYNPRQFAYMGVNLRTTAIKPTLYFFNSFKGVESYHLLFIDILLSNKVVAKAL